MSTTISINTQAPALPLSPTPITLKINLVCEDRDTGKKCLFKDLKITLLPDQNFKIIELIENNISLQYFLNNCMIFQPSDDDMDIMLGFYPSEEIQNQYLSHNSKTNITLKFEKIRPPSSESKKEETLPIPANQNQISNNKNTNNNTNNNNNIINNSNNINNNLKTNHTNASLILATQTFGQSQLDLAHNEQPISINNHSSNPQGNIFGESIVLEAQEEKLEGVLKTVAATVNIPQGTSAIISQLNQDDQNNNDSLIMSSHSLPMESEGCSQQIEPEVAIENQNASTEGSALQKNESSAFNKSEGCETIKDLQLNRKRKASEVLDHCSESCSGGQNESKECSPCTSFTDNEQPKLKKHQSAITNDPTLSEAGETNNCFTNSMNLSLNGKFPINLFGQIGTHNSSFHAYNPLTNITNNSVNSAAFNSNSGKNNEGISGFSFLTSQFSGQGNNSAVGGGSGNNSTNNMSRQSRNKERTIREAIEMVTKWRDLQEEYRQKHQVKGLQEVADELNISKKVLDYYFQELRTAEFFGFDFDNNLGNKMGVLRKYIDEQKKNHEQKNKNFKITRNLQFKYRLKDYTGSSYLSSCSSNNNNNNNNNNNDALSSTSSQKSKDKLQMKSQAKMEQVASLLSSSVSNGQVKVEEMAIEGNSENNFNYPNNSTNSGSTSTSQSSSTSNNSQLVAPNQIQEVFKNSPMFLQFMNNSSTCNNGVSNNSFPSSVQSGSSSSNFNLANQSSNNNNNNNNSSNSNSNVNNSMNGNSSILNGLNYLSSIGGGNNGFSMNPSHSDSLRKQQNQPQQSQQNSNNIDKNILLLELLFNQQIQQQQISQPKQEQVTSNEKTTTSSNQMDSLLTLFKILSSNDEPTTELNIPSFQKQNSASFTMNQKFQEEEFKNKQSKLIKPQKIAVIQIRKQDE